MSYASESRAYDNELLDDFDRWHRHGTALVEGDFSDLALRLFKYQVTYNKPYARYCASFGYSAESLPTSWHDIPALPTGAFKEATIATFDPAHAALAFETSGTTQGVGGRHYMETRDLYDEALLAGFDRFMLADGVRLRYLNLVPNPADRPQSSLGYMMASVSAKRGDGNTGWYVRGDDLFLDAFINDVRNAREDDQPVCIAATAFALVNLLDELRAREIFLSLPTGSRVMETGGFKGRSRIVERDDLYRELGERFGMPEDDIIAEYGMTELTSQYYDRDDLTRAKGRRKASPPWLRPRVVGPDGKTLPNGIVGALVHVDLANRSSCIAVQTEDLGVQFDDGLVLIGREQGAALRGCSLDAEDLRPR
jgi:hypothetical protein